MDGFLLPRPEDSFYVLSFVVLLEQSISNPGNYTMDVNSDMAGTNQIVSIVTVNNAEVTRIRILYLILRTINEED